MQSKQFLLGFAFPPSVSPVVQDSSSTQPDAIFIFFLSNPAIPKNTLRTTFRNLPSSLLIDALLMAAATISEIYRDHGGNNGSPEISRQEIQAAIAKAVELRALHAALMQGNSPSSNFRFHAPSSPPANRYASKFSAQDYPVFTPSYEDEPLSGYHQLGLKSETLSETWGEFGIGVENIDESAISEYKKEKSSSRKGVASTVSLESHICPADDQKSVTTIKNSPRTDVYKSSRRNSMGELKSISSCNQCKPAVITLASQNKIAPSQNPNKTRGVFLARLFPKLKKKHKNNVNESLSSPNRTESEDVYASVESLKKELAVANRCRDAALVEASQMKCLLEELRQKLEYLETYCDGLKKAVKGNKALHSDSENSMPVTEEVMTEGFLQIVAEARLSVKQFCKTLIGQVEETDSSLMDNLNVLLQPYKLSLNSRYSKLVLCHLESIINQTLYQDFENCVFQRNGSSKILDPNQERQAQFASFVSLRNLSWNEVLRKGTKFYSEEFSKFCDQKMSCIITTLNWTRPWPEQLLQSFFVSAKCIWLLHLLAFAFSPAVSILRVEENRGFDSQYMEDMFGDKQMSQCPSRVKVMVMPGFYVQDRVLRCKVLCKYKSSN